MNEAIKNLAIKYGIVVDRALNDPEGYDSYRTYDRMNLFISATKEYYLSRYEEMQKQEEEQKEELIVDLEKDELHNLMLMAHDRDVTLNEMCEIILSEFIEQDRLNQISNKENE
jgi:phosphoglycerate-specific signal transduction histidine kinase